MSLKRLKQGYAAPRLMASLHIFYGRHHEVVDRFSNGNGYFPFYVDFAFLYHRQDFTENDYMSKTEGV